jgi:hypothetical protein
MDRDKKNTTRIRQPVHASGCIFIIALDWLWFLVELTGQFFSRGFWVSAAMVAAVFVTGFVPVMLIQRLMSHDQWGRSLLKGALMGIALCIPYPVVGTFVGVILLATLRFSWKTQSEEPDQEAT